MTIISTIEPFSKFTKKKKKMQMHHTKCVSPTGAALPVHVPLRRVHWHGNHLQHHPPSGHRASDNAHAEVLLLGGQPCREQLHHSQGSRWVATLGRCCICFSRRRWILQKPQIPSWLCLFSGWLKPAPIRRERGLGGINGELSYYIRRVRPRVSRASSPSWRAHTHIRV